MTQGTPEWFAARCGKFTASRFGDLMARTKSGRGASFDNLIAAIVAERLTGRIIETYQNAAMERGVELENEARTEFEKRTGKLVMQPAFYVHPKYDFAGCSPDGEIDGALVEIKCPASMAKHLEALEGDSYANSYRWQLQGQMWVTGHKLVKFVSYDPRWPENLRLAIRDVGRDELAIKELEETILMAEEIVKEKIKELTK